MTVNIIENTRIRIAVLGLLLEVNSVFLHIRRLLSLVGMQTTRLYRLVAVANYVTLFVSRIVPMSICVRHFFSNAFVSSWTDTGILLPGTLFLLIHSWKLLYHLIIKDVRAQNAS